MSPARRVSTDRISAIFDSPHELESRPGVVDGADFHVDEAGSESVISNDSLGEIGFNARASLWPGDPQHAVGLEPVTQFWKLPRQLRFRPDEHDREIESAHLRDSGRFRQRSEERRKIRRRRHEEKSRTRLYA